MTGTRPTDGGPGPDGDLHAAVAVVGMSARVPGAADLDRFWAALVAGEDLTTPLESGGAYGAVTGGEWFDAAFFGVTGREALMLDPQQRVFLECCWEALEDAGYTPQSDVGAVGVYAGSGDTDHLTALRAHRSLFPDATDAQLRLAAGRDHLTARVAHALDLRGPAVTVHTACSTSLVAVHLAIQALLAGDTDTALAGGITLRAVPGGEDGDDTLSPRGRCRPFDADADGMVDADGAGVVVLRRLDDALEDGDHIEAVLLGSGLSNDGARKMSFTAPGVPGQVSAIRSAHLVADVRPDSIDVVEAHATGTLIGDTIEVRALTEAFGPPVGDRRCLLGSVKASVGHADAAAGVLGLIKMVLSLRRALVPGTAHFTTPNPHLGLATGSFRVTGEATPWPPGERPRRGGVTSTGVGGTTVHLVVQEAPAVPPATPTGGPHLLPVSARSASALARSVTLLRDRLRDEDLAVGDVAWTLQTGRTAFPHRAFVVCRDRDDAVAELTALVSDLDRGGHPHAPAPTAAPAAAPPRVAFLFPDDGGRHPGTAHELYTGEPVFRACIDDCAAQAGPELGSALLRRLTAPADPAAPAPGDDPVAARFAGLAVQCALVALWHSRGIRAGAVVASGSGVYGAAVADGVLSVAGAVSLLRAESAVRERVAGGAPLTDDLVAEHTAVLGAVRRDPPRSRWFCGRTGDPIAAREFTGPDHWSATLRDAARPDGRVVLPPATAVDVVVDLGPGAAVAIPPHAGPDGAGPVVVASLPDVAGAVGVARSIRVTGELWRAGVSVHWPGLHAGPRPRRVALPTYPFERERFALDGGAPPGPAGPGAAVPVAGPPRNGDEPDTPVERAIAEVWCSVLRLPRVGVHDDFFDLGGHSLLATRVLNRLGPALGRDVSHLSVLDLFDHATIRELAALVGGPAPEREAARE